MLIEGSTAVGLQFAGRAVASCECVLDRCTKVICELINDGTMCVVEKHIQAGGIHQGSELPSPFKHSTADRYHIDRTTGTDADYSSNRLTQNDRSPGFIYLIDELFSCCDNFFDTVSVAIEPEVFHNGPCRSNRSSGTRTCQRGGVKLTRRPLTEFEPLMFLATLVMKQHQGSASAAISIFVQIDGHGFDPFDGKVKTGNLLAEINRKRQEEPADTSIYVQP